MAFVSDNKVDRSVRTKHEVRVYGGRYTAGSVLTVVGEDFYGNLEVRDETGRCSTVRPDDVQAHYVRPYGSDASQWER